MGALLSYLWSGGPAALPPSGPAPDEPDAATGLTVRQRRFVVDTWALLKKDIAGAGIDLFIRFFELRPDALQRFPAFAGVPLEELRASKRLKAHTNSVMYALDAVVASLDDTECLHEMLFKLGENHARRAVTEGEFQDLKEALLDLLRARLDVHLSCEGERAWGLLVDAAYRSIFQGLRPPATATTTVAHATNHAAS